MTQNVNTVTNVRPTLWTKGQLDLMLFVLLGSEELAHNWWISPNTAFDDRFPKDVYYQDPQGRQEVSDYINAFASGSYK
jgi:uncharacterized protein (DUF2384 family)